MPDEMEQVPAQSWCDGTTVRRCDGVRFAIHLCVAVAIFDHRNEVKVVAEAQADRREATAGRAV